MKNKISICSLFVACLLTACGDDSSTNPDAGDTGESKASSSSFNDEPKSSVAGGSESKDTSSSSVVQSDSSEQEFSSSSEEIIESSSSKGFAKNYDPATGLLTDERDGEVYQTTQIGEQIWMAQSLRYLPAEPIEGCDFRFLDEREKPDSLETYGRIYSWIEATRINCEYGTNRIYFGSEEYPLPHQGLCPDGWHVPQIQEWQTLIDAVNTDIYGLISTDWTSFGYVGTDKYGFNVLKPAVGLNYIQFLVLENSSTFGYNITFNDLGTVIQVESAQGNKFADHQYLRCIMD